ncbi:lysosome-associated membrane glycoprotein 3 isoform X2 [Pyxicephalus adspersus]|uniref:lysosome-associated membrane glycoprotein 3 isoform X2 n=1 Tax=Pyxicephalus adspersus TaxID=30357 RepID=UPI003B5B3E27
MTRLTLIWGVLLLAGIFLADIYADPAPSNTTHTPLTTTLHAPSNTTTKSTPVPSTTTSHTPSNTTTKSTPVPSTTTSHTPSNTTTHPAPHTTPVLPTKPSPPSTGNYIVKNANETCIIANMGLELQLENSSKGKWYFNVNPKDTYRNGTCSAFRANLFLKFPEGSINFVFVKESKMYYIDEVSVNFSWNSTERWNGTARKLKLLSTDIGYSVKCKNTPTVNLAENLQLVIADVQLQAFDLHEGVFGKETVCRYDRNVIAWAIAVVVIIVIVIAIIIYFICYKKRSSGYERI